MPLPTSMRFSITAALLRRQERLLEALAIYENAVPHLANQALLWNNRGILLHDLGRMDQAIVSLDGALTLDPNLAQAHLNRGMVLVRLNRQDEALEAFGQALALQPRYPEALSSRGLAHKMLGRFAEARKDFDAALAIDPGFIYALANRGELDLLLGHLPKGWAEYEYRFFTERQTKPALQRPTPEWRGPGHNVQRLAVFADQGSGDSLQFSPLSTGRRGAGPRCDADLPAPPASRSARRHGRHECRGVRLPTMRSSMPRSRCPACRPPSRSTSLSWRSRGLTFRRSRRSWRSGRSASADTGFKVGLCWRGSQNWQCDPGRSVPFEALAPLATIPGVRFFSLQMPDNTERTGDARHLALEDLSGELDRGPDAFIDTAAVMAGLDLVITCDTSISHLAGALGRPVWVLLQAVPEWRWLLESERLSLVPKRPAVPADAVRRLVPPDRGAQGSVRRGGGGLTSSRIARPSASISTTLDCPTTLVQPPWPQAKPPAEPMRLEPV